MAFLDRGARSADAVALDAAPTSSCCRASASTRSPRSTRAWAQFFADLARALAIRLRHADREIRALEEA